MHVLVARDRKAVKFWLLRVRLDYNHGFTKVELATMAALVREHEAAIQRAWHEYFGGN